MIDLGLHLHPFLSSFPIVLATLLCGLELSLLFGWVKGDKSLTETLSVLLAVGIVSAFLSGYLASERANSTFNVPDQAIALHHAWGKVLLFLVVPLAALRLLIKRAKYNRALLSYMYGLLLVTTFVILCWVDYLGASLIFQYGAGVSAPMPAVASNG